MKCPKCQSTKLVTGNAGLITLIPFLYCPVCKVEAVEDVPPPPPSITEEDGPFKDLVSLPWYMGVISYINTAHGRPYYRVRLQSGGYAEGFIGDTQSSRPPPLKINGAVQVLYKRDPMSGINRIYEARSPL